MNPILLFIRKTFLPAAAFANRHYRKHHGDSADADSGTRLGVSARDDGNGFVEAPKVFGDFDDIGENPFIQQQGAASCAVKSQQLILEKFGIEVSESELAAEAECRGWFDSEGGTSPADVGKLLEAHGVPVNRFTDANIFTLQNELCQGHQVIVSVDSSELWHGVDVQDAADHALIVSCIDTRDIADPKVVLTDPGTGSVDVRHWRDFADAWEDGNCFMVSTQNPPPLTHAPEMCNFNYAAGTIPDFDGFSYSDFLAAHAHEIAAPDAAADDLCGDGPRVDLPSDVPALDESTDGVFAADDFSPDADVPAQDFGDADFSIDV